MDVAGSSPVSLAIFLSFFRDSVSNPDKKRATVTANKFASSVALAFYRVIFAIAKMGLLTLRRVAFALLRLTAGFALVSSPVYSY